MAQQDGSERAIAFTPLTASAIRRWYEHRPFGRFVFRQDGEDVRTTVERLRDRFRGAVVRAKIGRKLTPHDLRRTVGSLLAARGINQRVAMEVLGHSSIGTTAKFYQAVSAETIKNAVLSLRPTGSGN